MTPRNVWMVLAMLVALLPGTAPGRGEDCNHNGVEDRVEIETPDVEFRLTGEVEIKNPYSLAVLDADGDQDLDLITSTFPPELVTLENDGAGRFAPGPRIAVGIRILHSADLDGDADRELVGVGSGEILILWNDGDVAFPRRTGVPIHSGPVALETADLDGDGDTDIVTANLLRDLVVIDTVSVFLNEGGGVFMPPRNFASHDGEPVLGAGDLDGDGDPDVVVATPATGEIRVLENDGLARFRPAGPPGGIPGFEIVTIAVADLDGDGRAEIIASTSPTRLFLLTLSDGGRLDVAGDSDAFGYHIHPHDVSGDGTIDLVLASSCPDVALIPGGTNLEGRRDIWLGIGGRTVRAGDWDRDGLEDLAGLGHRSFFAVRQTASTRSRDCNRNGIRDECEPDCDRSGDPDDCDIASGRSPDCDRNGVPDGCDPDCDLDGVPDACEIASGTAADCDANGVPDACDLVRTDGDGNGVPDSCDIAREPRLDCNANGIHDAVELEARLRFAAEEYELGGPSTMALLADMNGDGLQDIVAGNDGGVARSVTGGDDQIGISILEQVDGGAFAPARVYHVETVLDLAAFDADGDGDLDLAAGTRARSCQSSVSVLRNHGAFRLGKGQTYAMDTDVLSIAAGDLDGDGIDDIAAGTQRVLNDPGAVWTLAGHGDGTFGFPRRVGDLGGPIAPTDVDGDGDLDIAAGEGAILLNEGAGAFVEGSRLGFEAREIAAADIDGDLDQDLILRVVLHLELLVNDGRAGFVPAGNPIPEARDTDSFALADLDGDGRLDLAVPAGAAESAVSVFLRRADGEFFAASIAPTLSNIRHLTAGDVDGDGLTDIVAVDWIETVAAVLRNRGGGVLRSRASFAIGNNVLSDADVTDLDADGDLDIAAATWSPDWSVELHENDGLGSYKLRRSITHNRNPITLRAADLDRDGRPDLVMTEHRQAGETCTVAVLGNAGGWNFGPAERRHTTERFVDRLAVADLDADGDIDAAILNRDSRDVSMFLNDGRGELGAAVSSPIAPPGTFLEDFHLASIDGDPLPDLYVVARGAIRVLRNAGDGTFGETWLPLELPGELQASAAADIDGDGDDDFVLGRFVDQVPRYRKLDIFRNVQGGALVWSEDYSVRGDVMDLLPVDLDGDEDPDLLTAFPHLATSLEVLENNAGSIRRRGQITLPGDVTFIAARDLDGDGDQDVVYSDGHRFSVLRNDTVPPALRDADRDGLPDECERARFRRGDADQDGAPSLSDAVQILGVLFQGFSLPTCPAALDADDTGRLDITDPVAILGHLFLGRGPLPEPFGECGPDPTPDALACSEFGPCA